MLRTRQNVAFFSLELLRREVSKRILRLKTEISKSLDEYDKEDLKRTQSLLWQMIHMPLWIDDSSKTCPHLIKEECIQLNENEELGLIVVDYLQLLQTDNSQINRREQHQELLRSLKAIAKTFNCAILVLSQLDRAQEDFKRKCLNPRFDHGIFGFLQNDADLHLSLYRNFNDSGITKMTINKNRRGICGEFEMSFDKRSLSFIAMNDRRTLEEFFALKGLIEFQGKTRGARKESTLHLTINRYGKIRTHTFPSYNKKDIYFEIEYLPYGGKITFASNLEHSVSFDVRKKEFFQKKIYFGTSQPL